MNLDLITNALGEANIQLRNLETETSGLSLRVVDAKLLDDYLSLMVSLSSKMHIKCREELVKDATRTLNLAGYEVVSPSAPSSVDIAIALLVKNGYKVTDNQGRNY